MKGNELADNYLKIGDSLEKPGEELWKIYQSEIKRFHESLEDSLEQGFSEHFDITKDDVMTVGKILHYIVSIEIGRRSNEDNIQENLDVLFKDLTTLLSKYLPLFK